MRKVRNVKALIAFIGLALSAITCTGQGSTAPPPTAASSPTQAFSATEIGKLTLSDTGCVLDAVPLPLAPGTISLALVNQTGAMVIVNMLRISDGHTYEEFARDILVAKKAAEAGEPVVHRPSYVIDAFSPLDVSGGASKAMTGTAVAGTYGIVCLRMYEKLGEIRPFGVAGPLEFK